MPDPTTPHQPLSPPEAQIPVTPLPPSRIWATLAPAQQHQVLQFIVTIYRTVLTTPTAMLQPTEVLHDHPTAHAD